MKLFRCAAWLGLLLALGRLAAAEPVAADPFSRTRQLLASGQPVRIVCFGDSITGVYYHSGGRRAWCDLVGLGLRQLYPHARPELLNAGISGNTSADALRRLEADVLRHQPQLVVVMFGMNDVARATPGDYRANLRQIVQQVQQRNAEVMLLTPNCVSPEDPLRPLWKVADYAQITREVGRELQVPVTDTFRAFQSVQAVDHRAWLGLMSDAIHPNMRGHKLLAEEVVQTLTGQRVRLGDLPPLQPGLPRLLARLRAREPARIVAMKPYDLLIGPALRTIFPDAQVEVTAWDPAGKSLADLEVQAKSLGWAKYREQPGLARPDLFVVAVPAGALAASDPQFFHAYTWIINWSLSFDPRDWNALVILPSVAQPDQTPAQLAAEQLAREVILGQDVPWLQRQPRDAAPAAELLRRELAALLTAPAS